MVWMLKIDFIADAAVGAHHRYSQPQHMSPFRQVDIYHPQSPVAMSWQSQQRRPSSIHNFTISIYREPSNGQFVATWTDTWTDMYGVEEWQKA
ncbi:expressed protein [Echinococcus multilocularis]|uniref:Expressed protein n=1 Tax=Echinococcus multilocularis TaxID=6211 RepID=A0A068Y6P8_ECHMU|nr:expressed protein [Echinococcus multilocularis]